MSATAPSINHNVYITLTGTSAAEDSLNRRCQRRVRLIRHSTSLSSCSCGDGQVEVVAQRISISCGLGHCAVGLRGLTHASRMQCDHRGGVLGRSATRERLAPFPRVHVGPPTADRAESRVGDTSVHCSIAPLFVHRSVHLQTPK